jgi:hypothetical protein
MVCKGGMPGYMSEKFGLMPGYMNEKFGLMPGYMNEKTLLPSLAVVLAIFRIIKEDVRAGMDVKPSSLPQAAAALPVFKPMLLPITNRLLASCN